MALFTGKGDGGTTKTFACDQRISKSSIIAEALGTLDEVNSYLGVVKLHAERGKISFGDMTVSEIVHQIQENLFCVQAEVAGADKRVGEEKVTEASNLVNEIEKTLPPIHSFFISGGTELAAHFDFARTLSRRAERRVVAVHEEAVEKEGQKIDAHTLAYLNRLSSVLYALARYSNHVIGVTEQKPSYE